MPGSPVKAIPLSSYVGFDTITQQIERKLLARGFTFNCMVVGRSGLGKSTFVNTLFAGHLVDSKAPQKAADISKTTEILPTTHMIQENGVSLQLTIIDTPGYGDNVNNDHCWDPIVKYIKEQYSVYMRKELTPMRERYINDTRVHCILFFISPTGHALAPLDIAVLQRLSELANVIPIIAKSDSLTLEERTAFKERIREEIIFHNIKIFSPLILEPDFKKETLKTFIKELNLPFAVVGSEQSFVVDGKTVRGRKTRFGVINVENEEHCEFVKLRNFMTRHHLQDLIDATNYVHYEAFRSKQLLALKDSKPRAESPDRKPIPPIPQ